MKIGFRIRRRVHKFSNSDDSTCTAAPRTKRVRERKRGADGLGPACHRRHQPAVTHGALAQVRGFDLAVEQVDVFAGVHDGELIRAHPFHLPSHLRGCALLGVSQRLGAAPHLVLVVVPSARFAYAAAEATEESAEEAREVHAEAREEVHGDGVVHQDERHQDATPAAKGVLLLTSPATHCYFSSRS